MTTLDAIARGQRAAHALLDAIGHDPSAAVLAPIICALVHCRPEPGPGEPWPPGRQRLEQASGEVARHLESLRGVPPVDLARRLRDVDLVGDERAAVLAELDDALLRQERERVSLEVALGVIRRRCAWPREEGTGVVEAPPADDDQVEEGETDDTCRAIREAQLLAEATKIDSILSAEDIPRWDSRGRELTREERVRQLALDFREARRGHAREAQDAVSHQYRACELQNDLDDITEELDSAGVPLGGTDADMGDDDLTLVGRVRWLIKSRDRHRRKRRKAETQATRMREDRDATSAQLDRARETILAVDAALRAAGAPTESVPPARSIEALAATADRLRSELTEARQRLDDQRAATRISNQALTKARDEIAALTAEIHDAEAFAKEARDEADRMHDAARSAVAHLDDVLARAVVDPSAQDAHDVLTEALAEGDRAPRRPAAVLVDDQHDRLRESARDALRQLGAAGGDWPGLPAVVRTLRLGLGLPAAVDVDTGEVTA